MVLLGTLSGRKALCGKVLYGRDEPEKHFKALNSTFFFFFSCWIYEDLGIITSRFSKKTPKRVKSPILKGVLNRLSENS